jgi:hypothetical protein
MLSFSEVAQLSHVPQDKPHFPLRKELLLDRMDRANDTSDTEG